jgi:ketosteroid isomerase-like protein
MKKSKVVILLLLALLAFSACSKKMGPEERVREVVRKTADMVRAKDLKGFMRLVSKDYNDDAGNDYKGVKGIVFYQFMRPGALRVFLRDVEVEVRGELATVDTRAFLVRSKDKDSIVDIIPEDAEGFRFSVVMRLEDGQWRALSANWEAVGMLGLL